MLLISSLSPFFSLLLWTRNFQKIWHTPSDTKSLWHWCCCNPSFLASKILPLSNVSTCNKYYFKDGMMHLLVCSLIRGVRRRKKVVVRMSLDTKDQTLFQTRQQQRFWSSWPLGCPLQVFPLVRNKSNNGPIFVMFMSDWDRWRYVGVL